MGRDMLGYIVVYIVVPIALFWVLVTTVLFIGLGLIYLADVLEPLILGGK